MVENYILYLLIKLNYIFIENNIIFFYLKNGKT
jgi:hypothetical protein